MEFFISFFGESPDWYFGTSDLSIGCPEEWWDMKKILGGGWRLATEAERSELLMRIWSLASSIGFGTIDDGCFGGSFSGWPHLTDSWGRIFAVGGNTFSDYDSIWQRGSVFFFCGMIIVNRYLIMLLLNYTVQQFLTFVWRLSRSSICLWSFIAFAW